MILEGRRERGHRGPAAVIVGPADPVNGPAPAIPRTTERRRGRRPVCRPAPESGPFAAGSGQRSGARVAARTRPLAGRDQRRRHAPTHAPKNLMSSRNRIIRACACRANRHAFWHGGDPRCAYRLPREKRHGCFDLFSKDGRDQRAREKNAGRAINKYAQSPDRMKALQSLRDDGSPEALYGLMRRFGMMYDKTIEDEQEKDWVFESLVEKGGVAARAAQEVPADGRLDLLAAAPARQDRGDEGRADRRHRGGDAAPRAGLRARSHQEDPAAQPPGGLKNARVPPLVVPYLADMDEGVRYAAVEALLQAGGRGGRRASRCWSTSSRIEEESLRHRIRIAEASPSSAGRSATSAPRSRRASPTPSDRGARRRAGAHQEEAASKRTEVRTSRAETRPTSRPSC